MLEVASTTQHTWGYLFDHIPPYSAINVEYEYPGSSRERAECLGVYHSSPLPYLFADVKALPDSDIEDCWLSDYMTRRYTIQCHSSIHIY
jgi:hypothetical protein